MVPHLAFDFSAILVFDLRYCICLIVSGYWEFMGILMGLSDEVLFPGFGVFIISPSSWIDNGDEQLWKLSVLCSLSVLSS